MITYCLYLLASAPRLELSTSSRIVAYILYTIVFARFVWFDKNDHLGTVNVLLNDTEAWTNGQMQIVLPHDFDSTLSNHAEGSLIPPEDRITNAAQFIVHTVKRCTSNPESRILCVLADRAEPSCVCIGVEGQEVSREGGRLQHKRVKTTSLLNFIFRDVESYRRLLSCDTADAQRILDAFQLLLDTGSFHDRTQLIAAMHRLSARTELYPKGFFLEGIELSADDVPVGSDGFCDIYKIIFKGEETCFKVLRVNQQSRVEDIAKVYAKEAILWAQLSHPNILPFFGLAKQ